MTNIKLTYDYTLNSIKVINNSIDKLNTKLTVVLTLSGVLVNYRTGCPAVNGKDLPGYSVFIKAINCEYPCLTCYLFKLIAYILIVVAIAIGLWGLAPAHGGKIILPEQLLTDEWNSATAEDYMTAMIQYLEKETLLVLNEIRDFKASRLQWAVWVMSVSVLFFVLDEMLGISIPVLAKICLSIITS